MTTRQRKQKPLALTMDDLQLSPDDRRYSDAAACVRIYWAQATELSSCEQESMIEYIKLHLESVKHAGIPVEQHPLYQMVMKMQNIDRSYGLTWYTFLVLSAVYPELPVDYVNSIEEAHGSSKIEDHSDKYFKQLGLKKREQLASIAVTKSNPSIQAKLSTPGSSPDRHHTNKNLDTLQTKLDAMQAEVDGAPSRLKAAMDNSLCHDDDEE